MPLPAVRCRPEQTIVKMEMAPDLSLRGRIAPVAISGRHWRFVQAADKMVCTDCVCSGAQLSAMGSWQIWRHCLSECAHATKFVIARPRRGRGNLGKAVSFSPMAFLRSGYDLRDCTPRALPRASRSGRHVGLRPPRNDKLGGLAPLNVLLYYLQPALGAQGAPLQPSRPNIRVCIPGNAGKLSLWEGSQNVQKKLPFGY